MKKILLLLIFSTAVLFVLHGQQTFNKRLHFGYPAAVLTSVVATDSCIYATGVIADSVYPYKVGTLFAKFDLEGNVVFQKAITNQNKSYEAWANTLIPLEDGGFALSGYLVDTLMKVIFIRYDSAGDPQFIKEYFNPYYPIKDFLRPNDMKQTPDGGFVMVNWMGTPSSENKSTQVSVLKIDSLGNMQWHKVYGNNLRERPESILVESNGDIIIGAVRGNNNLVLEDYTYQTWIFSLTSQGDLKWTYLSPLNLLRDAANDMALLPDGSLLVASGVGTEYPRPSVNVVWYEKYFFILDTGHELEWSVEILGDHPTSYTKLEAVVALEDQSGFVGIGISPKPDPVDENWGMFGWIGKISPSGGILWEREYTSLTNNIFTNRPFSIKETSDHGFIIVGESFDKTYQDSIPQQAWLLKVDEYGCLVPGCQLVGTKEVPGRPSVILKPYPNPAMDELFIFFKAPSSGSYRFQIIDDMGRIVKEFSTDSSEMTFILDVSQWAAGIYFLQCRDEEGRVVSKVIEVVEKLRVESDSKAETTLLSRKPNHSQL
ncbi:MAG: T9SS type A sorting domain-containing protein [Lewinellaceae bacterium]|nr:T9SS type A sorting domain-containing protein [Lewinellaceae bacterium]